MWVYIICAGIWICFILHQIIGSIPKRRFFEVYAGCSISTCLTLLIFGLFGWYQKAISPVLQVIGNILICITVVLNFIRVDKSKCNSCGLCETLCPVNNIKLMKYPEFLKNCILCMRCFAYCPKEAISFKNYSSARYRGVEVDEFLI